MRPTRHVFPASPLGTVLLGTYPVTRSDAERETDDPVAAALGDARVLVLELRDGTLPVREADGAARLAWRGAEALAGEGAERRGDQELAHLGTHSDGSPVVLDFRPESPPEQMEAGDPWPGDLPGRPDETWEGLREAAPRLDAEESTWATIAVALATWHSESPHCPACGSATRISHGGWARLCLAEDREIFPRTDPAIIAAVTHTDDDGVERLLLGHSTRWPEGRFSTFAGFVEAGESLEAAVAREIWEEAGITVDRVEYRGSQPWPFPRSLMLGFRARATDLDAARPDGREISRVRWFTREELDAEVRAGRLILPGAVSIAHHLIADWYGEPLPEPEEDRTF
ncbi:NAD(+) diphosphatase [Rothia sp. AR01]|uniref:NAD(+) diphosphatase n=1 Tax=Rothia santali TaxID=2949643 RepID=A0A9X2KLU8_9MICC|nr:NAD(+) diphosphatase [Rothia santali]MCP3426536.1 NAD(+) diphosphatase [Rothia santali]